MVNLLLELLRLLYQINYDYSILGLIYITNICLSSIPVLLTIFLFSNSLASTVQNVLIRQKLVAKVVSYAGLLLCGDVGYDSEGNQVGDQQEEGKKQVGILAEKDAVLMKLLRGRSFYFYRSGKLHLPLCY